MKQPYRTRVKICGITSLDDAIVAVRAGADAIGLVFFEKSPRCVDIKQAQKIVQGLAPFVNCVGLFVDADEVYIREVLQSVALDTLQFHGQETAQACALYGKPYIKAVRMHNDIDLFQQVAQYQSAQALLLDAYVKDKPGGTGVCFEWHKIPTDLEKPIILAGGLTPDNIQEALLTVNPYAVDVSSGVEYTETKKDTDKIIRFISKTIT